ncbi:hypothetical protein [Streptomyces sp. NPDC015350]|uniref:hypothetical protein n=1 Tax=Streptomyces sp. NPDC015350 TaxID=3364955 RepID=UPI0037003EEC
MIRTVVTCDRDACQAIYLPTADAGAEALEQAARVVGWRRQTTHSHTCPACTTGTGPVLERGECPACSGRTYDRADGMVCQYCQTLTPHPADDWS